MKPHWGQAGLYFEPRPSLCPLAQGKVILDQGPSLFWEPRIKSRLSSKPCSRHSGKTNKVSVLVELALWRESNLTTQDRY